MFHGLHKPSEQCESQKKSYNELVQIIEFELSLTLKDTNFNKILNKFGLYNPKIYGMSLDYIIQTSSDFGRYLLNKSNSLNTFFSLVLLVSLTDQTSLEIFLPSFIKCYTQYMHSFFTNAL